MDWNGEDPFCNSEVSCVLHSVDFEGSPNLLYVYVNSSGTIKNSKPIQVVSACSLETYAFPFDIQNCSLTFSSALHTGKLGEAQSASGRHTAWVGTHGWHLVVPSARSLCSCTSLTLCKSQCLLTVLWLLLSSRLNPVLCLAHRCCWFGNTIFDLCCLWEGYRSSRTGASILRIMEYKL